MQGGIYPYSAYQTSTKEKTSGAHDKGAIAGVENTVA
jgi:hypothetical protein